MVVCYTVSQSEQLDTIARQHHLTTTSEMPSQAVISSYTESPMVVTERWFEQEFRY